jgi:two-component system heavy metal sensor histidine kinase CusS
MRSIGARLTLFYAISATLTLAILFFVGYYLLQQHLIRGLDLLNETEYEQIKMRLGPDYRNLAPEVVDQRIRETTESASVLFYIDIHGEQSHRFFRSHNLGGGTIPDVPGQRKFNAEVPVIGELRVGEFLLPPFEVMIGTQLAQVRKVMEGYIEVCAALLSGMLAASVLLGFGLSRLVLRPVRMIRETASRIGSHNLSERINVGDVKDEMSELARLLNEMFDRIEESFERIRRFTAEASHELKTPLSLVRLHAEKMLVAGDLPATHRESVQVQLEELTRLNQIIEELLFIARADSRVMSLELKAHDPEQFLHGFAQDAAVLAEHYGCRFSCVHAGHGEVRIEAKWIRQVLLNLLTNALKVSPPGGAIALQSELADGTWKVSLTDQGPGLDADQRVRMFERFVRFTMPDGDDKGGTGLGLAISRSIIGLHRGQIYATPGPGDVGLTVTFEIPAPQSPSAGTEAPPSREPQPTTAEN